MRLDLYGSTIAQFSLNDKSHALDIKPGGVICATARAMLTLGVDPEEKIDVRRDGRPVFDRQLTVEKWANLTVSEDGDRGVRFRRYRGAETPQSANSTTRVPECPGERAPVDEPSIPDRGRASR